jgi:anti-sigma-K factor RskA
VTGPENEPCRYQEWAVAWALHALEPDEEQEFRGHLPQCASCRAVVEDADEVLASLGAAVEQVDPPPSLRASLMSAAAQTRRAGRPRRRGRRRAVTSQPMSRPVHRSGDAATTRSPPVPPRPARPVTRGGPAAPAAWSRPRWRCWV